MPLAIGAEGLSKRYRVGARLQKHDTLGDAIARAARARMRKGRSDAEHVWALRDVSFEIREGEIVGIIGRNGAGKSTLLKILSRVTDPTEGSAEIRGRVGSLLEVGTGFHPELTGRENVFLNGAILGMRRSEIVRKFEEIVAFAEVERFIDTPVKRYSTGMTVRLAFAVAAHLDPEILLVDEVLAVGDAAFQRKSLGKMGDVVKEGRTVLFVSHQLGMISTLCDSAMLLHEGRLLDRGPSAAIIDRYIRSLADGAGDRGRVEWTEDPTKPAVLLGAEVTDAEGRVATAFDVFDPVTFNLTYGLAEPLEGVAINLVVRRNGDILFVSFDSDHSPDALRVRGPGRFRSSVTLPCPLKAGRYTLDVSIGRLNVGGIDLRNEALAFEVEERSYDTSMRAYSSRRPGMMAAHLPWTTEAVTVTTGG